MLRLQRRLRKNNSESLERNATESLVSHRDTARPLANWKHTHEMFRDRRDWIPG